MTAKARKPRSPGRQRARELVALLDPDTPVPAVMQPPQRPLIATTAVPTTTIKRHMAEDYFAVTAGCGHYGTGDALIPGQGRVTERAFASEERAALGDALPVLGETTFDVYINGTAFCGNVPAAICTYKLGGYQVLKKGLSYRHNRILGRTLNAEEVRHFTDTARRVAAVIIGQGRRIINDG